jgi:processive 1,2-diacylglycerol beta-glucosyltransferase
MVEIFDAANGASLGHISEQDLNFLEAQLEEESVTDQDYYINRDTVDNFELEGGPAGLVSLLRKALGNRDDMDIRWERD